MRERVARVMGKNVAQDLVSHDELPADLSEAPAQDAALLVVEQAERQSAEARRLRAKYDGAFIAGRIDEETRDMLVLKNVEGLNTHQIAGRYGRTWGAVRRHLARAEKRVEGEAKQRPHGRKPRRTLSHRGE